MTMSNGIGTIPVCAHAYCASKGFHIKLNDLLTMLRKEKPNAQGLIDLENGCFVSPLDTQAGIEELIRDHSGIANLREVLEHEYQTGIQNALDEHELAERGRPSVVDELEDEFDDEEEDDDDEEEDWDDDEEDEDDDSEVVDEDWEEVDDDEEDDDEEDDWDDEDDEEDDDDE